MAAPYNKERQAEVERRAWELRVKGRTESSIARELETTQQTVSRALARIEIRLQKQFSEYAERVKVRQTEQLDYVIEEALGAWERSKEAAEKEIVLSGRIRTTPEGKDLALPDQMTRTREGQCGDASFLAQARGAWSDQRAIWGAEAPKKVAETNSRGEDLPAGFRVVAMIGAVEKKADEQPG